MQIICDVLALEELGYVSRAVRKDVLSYLPTEVHFLSPTAIHSKGQRSKAENAKPIKFALFIDSTSNYVPIMLDHYLNLR